MLNWKGFAAGAAAALIILLTAPAAPAQSNNVNSALSKPNPDTTRTNGPAKAEMNDMLLDLLVKKGYVTQQEAHQVKAESEAMASNNMANMPKWSISSGIKSVELFGDVRMRFENRQARAPGGGALNLDRYRYALRLGLRGELKGDFYYGLRLETASNPRSPWVTFGTSSSGVPYQGPFGKSTAGINLGQIYLGWHPNSNINLTVGQMPMPLYTTPMVWDSDISPQGAAERFNYDIGPANFFATFTQFLYEDANPTTSSPFLFSSSDLGHNANPPFLMAMQGGLSYKITDDLSFKAAATLYSYMGHGYALPTNGPLQGGSGFSDIFVGEGAGGVVPGYPNPGASGFPGGSEDGFYYNQTGVNDLLVLEFPFEVDFKLFKQHWRAFGDWAENLDGSKRALAAAAAAGDPNIYATPLHISVERNQNKAYQFGLAVSSEENLGLVYGTAVRRGAWEARFYYQHVDQYALDPNLLDSDFFEGRGNMEGFYAALAYGLSDSIIGTVRYGYASRIDKKLGTGGSNQDIPQVNPLTQYQLVQADLTLRF